MADVTIYSSAFCPYCEAAKRFFGEMGRSIDEIRVDDDPELLQKLFDEHPGWRTVPMIFVNGTFVGGYTDVLELHRSGKLEPLFQGETTG